MTSAVQVTYRPLDRVSIHAETDGSRLLLLAAGAADQIALAAKRAELLTPLVTDGPGVLELPLSWPAVVQLANTFGTAWQPGPTLTRWVTSQVSARAQDFTALPLLHPLADQPDGRKPYSWQSSGAAMIGEVGSVLIVDDPGTGKTLTAVLGLAEREIRGVDVWPCVVVAPHSTLDAWVETFGAWLPDRPAVAYRGTPAQRKALLKRGQHAVYVTGYPLLRRDGAQGGPLHKLKPAALVVDECHMIKNPHSVQSQAARRLARKASTVIGLSGTPITHHPGDLWPMLDAMEAGAWPSRERFYLRYLESAQGDYGADVLGLDQLREPEFRTTLLGAMRRVSKVDALELPPKIYSVRTVELPAEYRTAYDSMADSMLAKLPDVITPMMAASILIQLTRLDQLASAAADVEDYEEDGKDGLPVIKQRVTLRMPSWKVDALLEVLAERPGVPVVVCAPSAQLMRLAGPAAEAAGRRVGYVIGGQTPKQRTAAREAFRDGQLDLMCVTTGAGGVGLDGLQVASTQVHLSSPYSVVDRLQMEGRQDRIGQRGEALEIIDIVARDTVDTRKRDVLWGKAAQLSDLLQDPRIVAELLGGRKQEK